MTPYTFTRQNGTSKVVVILIGVYAALLALVILFDAAWWLMGLLSLATLPAIWDIVHDSSASLTLDQEQLRWHTGKRQGEIEVKDVDFFRFDTRWDFSVRVTVVLTSGKRIRLPDESVPPHRQFEDVLQSAGFRVERHHFTVF
ncbi:hypothetical protein HW561_02245 [Rhodobacteraceae bacterium B1Z28]|uniref:Uncharacterized protein n=1 Tax=Ruegeria haliotis TaxID=2747601 RepID=A0ABX2PKG0_9RHOB|nr:hypothetical protein [Ruegeria haliotis]NVO54608.1 hypothetical protein [Ruegeria haliotis]